MVDVHVEKLNELFSLKMTVIILMIVPHLFNGVVLNFLKWSTVGVP